MTTSCKERRILLGFSFGAFVAEPTAAVFGGDGVRVVVLHRLLAADQPSPDGRALASAAVPLPLRFHAGGRRRREERGIQSAGDYARRERAGGGDCCSAEWW